MICPKCGRKYDDDMPKCLWCDAPNSNYGNEPTVAETQTNQSNNSQDSAKEKGPRKGTLIFWMSLILGEAGVLLVELFSVFGWDS